MKERTYQEILDADPPLGRVSSGEVEVTPSPTGSENGGPIGVIYQDRYLTLVRDPVTFPNYAMGGHLRILEGDPTRRRVAVILLALRPNADGSFDFAMVRQYRHPVNGWATEIPRGLIAPGETPAAGALRELREETGLREPALMVSLGEMANNSGISGTIGCYYAALYLGHHRMVQREKNETEAISNVIWVPLKDWRKAITQPGAPGRAVAPVDLFTMGAFGLAHMTGYLDHLLKNCRRMYANHHIGDERVHPALRRRLEAGAETIPARVRCSAPEVVHHFRRELPTLNALPVEGDETAFDVTTLNPLTLMWLLSTAAVTAVDSNESQR